MIGLVRFDLRTSLLISLILTVVLNAAFCSGGLPGMGRLPGDVRLEGEGWSIYAPIATSLVLSVGLSLILLIVARLGRRR